MLRLAADENLTNGIIRGLGRRGVQADIVRVQDVGLLGADDPRVLAWAAAEGRILVTHDSRTVPHYANQRADAGCRCRECSSCRDSFPWARRSKTFYCSANVRRRQNGKDLFYFFRYKHRWCIDASSSPNDHLPRGHLLSGDHCAGLRRRHHQEVNLLLILAGMLLGPFLLNWRAVKANLRGLKVDRNLPLRICAGDVLSSIST